MALNFAKNTKISGSKSEDQIRKMLKKFGASNIIPLDGVEVGSQTFIGIVFEYQSRRVRMTIEIPDPDSDKFKFSPGMQKQRTDSQRQQFWLKEIDRLWRALAFKIKAKLVSIEDEISDFEEEFFFDLIAPGTSGETVGAIMRPQLDAAYQSGKLPPLLGMSDAGTKLLKS